MFYMHAICMCMCLYVCMYICTQMYTTQYIFRGQRSTSGIFFQALPPNFLRQALPLDLELTDSSILMSPRVHTGIIYTGCCAQPFIMLGIPTQVFMIVLQALCLLRHLLCSGALVSFSFHLSHAISVLLQPQEVANMCHNHKSYVCICIHTHRESERERKIGLGSEFKYIVGFTFLPSDV